MNLRLIRVISITESTDEYHLCRLLLLLRAAEGRTGKPVDGIMKLAKLDFFLRYPSYLERMLTAIGKDPLIVQVTPYERTTIESKMIRFKYGPWDHRYRRWLGIITSTGLGNISVVKKTMIVNLTSSGQQMADRIADLPEFADLAKRSKVVISAVNSFSPTKLRSLVYEVFPEIVSLKWGEEISLCV